MDIEIINIENLMHQLDTELCYVLTQISKNNNLYSRSVGKEVLKDLIYVDAS